MKEYHKIQTLYKRDPETKFKTLLEGEFSVPEFAYLQNNHWSFTEKVDGTNIRIMFDGASITIGGKTERAQIPAELMNTLHSMLLPELPVFGELFPEGACLYGEGYGPKIQKGGKYRDSQSFVLFDVKIGPWWLQRKDVEDIGTELKLDIVPIIGEGTLFDMKHKVRGGFASEWGDFIAEGIVARPTVELKARNGGRIITKLKYKDFNGSE